MGRLIYLPVEAYPERWTWSWAAPKIGWLERRWIENKIDYERIDGQEDWFKTAPIKTGVAVDAVRRASYCFRQVEQVLKMLEDGRITDNDVIYMDDFWHPGVEAIPYAMHMLKVRPKLFAYCHAQSVDCFDFTYPMRRWMRPIEIGISRFLDGIFVACPTLKDLLVLNNVAPEEKVFVTGPPICVEEMQKRLMTLPLSERQDRVIFSSRWDKEKNPDFFLKVVDAVLAQRPNTHFMVCTGQKGIRSNQPGLLSLLNEALIRHGGKLTLAEGLRKDSYYHCLQTAKVQFSCADQDFVSITLLEASVAGCYPIYPETRSFPETFLHRPGFMYHHRNVDSAAGMVIDILNRNDLWTPEAVKKREWIHNRFDDSWERMLHAMDDRWGPVSIRAPFNSEEMSLRYGI